MQSPSTDPRTQAYIWDSRLPKLRTVLIAANFQGSCCFASLCAHNGPILQGPWPDTVVLDSVLRACGRGPVRVLHAACESAPFLLFLVAGLAWEAVLSLILWESSFSRNVA